MATNVKNILLEVVGRADDAQRSLLDLAESVRELPDHKTLEVEAQTRQAQKDIRAMLAALKTIDRSEATAAVNVAITKATLKLEAFDEQLDNLEGRRVRAHLEVAVERQQIAQALAQAQELLEATTARQQTVTVKIDMQIADAEANIARIQAEIAALPADRTVEIAAKAEALDAELAKAEAKLNAFVANRRVTELRFDAQTERAEANIARLAAAEAALPDSHEIDIRVNQSIIGDLGRANAMIADTTGRLGKLIDQGQRFGAEMSNATFRASLGFLSFGGAIGPVFAIIAALTVVIGTSLVGALLALAASFAAAAAGAAAFGAAIVAALGPIIGLAIAVAQRLGKVLEVLKAEDAAAHQIGQKAAQGSQAATAAAQRQAAAAEGLRDAQERLRQATVQAWREMEDAAEAYSDAVRGIADAELGLDSARLSIREAEAALQDYMATLDGVAHLSEDFKKFTDVSFDFDTGALAGALKGVSFGGDDAENAALRLERLILNVREARQREKNAVDAVSDAERNRSRTLQTHNAFVRDSIAASQGYQAALRGVRDAQRQVNAAIEEPQMLAAQAKAITLVGELTEKEKELLAAIKQVRRELRGAFRAATDAVFGGMIRSLQRIPQFINPLRGAFGRLGRDIAASLDIFSRELIRPEWIAAIRRFIEAGGRIARVFTGDLLVPFLRLVRDVALSALPHFERMLKRVGAAMQRLQRSAGPERMRDAVASVVRHLESWLSLAYQLARVFVNFVRAAGGEGRGLVDTMADGARKFADFLGTTRGRNTVREFMHEAIEATKTFVENVGLLTLAILEFVSNVSPALTKVFGLFNKVLGALDKLGLNQGAIFFIGDALDRLRSTGPDAAAAALKRLAKAEDELRDSHLDLDDAQRDLTDALREGRRELEDMRAAASGAKLSRRRADLDVRDAKARLAALQREGAGATEIERAQLDLADARLRLSEAIRDEKRAIDDNRVAQAGGVKGTDAYQTAADRLREAMNATAKAIHELAEAQQDVADPPEPNLSPWERIRNRVRSVADDIGGAFSRAWRRLVGGSSNAFATLRGNIGRLLGGIPGLVIARGPELFRGAVRWAGNIASGIRDRSQAIRGAVGSAITGAIARVRDFLSDAWDVGKSLGRRIADGVAEGFRALKELGRTIINGLIDLMNDGIELINKATPGKVEAFGKTIIPAIPDIKEIPKLAGGGMTTGETVAVVGDNPGGREAVLPLTRRIMRQLAQAITAQMSTFAFTPALATSGGPVARSSRAPAAASAGGPVFPDAKFIIESPAGSYPDARTTMTNLERLVERVGGDPNV